MFRLSPLPAFSRRIAIRFTIKPAVATTIIVVVATSGGWRKRCTASNRIQAASRTSRLPLNSAPSASMRA